MKEQECAGVSLEEEMQKVKIFLKKCTACSDADEELLIRLLAKKIVYERVGVEFRVCIVCFVDAAVNLMQGPFRKGEKKFMAKYVDV